VEINHVEMTAAASIFWHNMLIEIEISSYQLKPGLRPGFRYYASRRSIIGHKNVLHNQRINEILFGDIYIAT
jgi:hypothetical protein